LGRCRFGVYFSFGWFFRCWHRLTGPPLSLIVLSEMRTASIVAGALAWVFLARWWLLGMNSPVWMGAVTFGGFVLCALGSVILTLFQSKARQERTWLGFWLGILALAAFATIFFVLPVW
jgi:hypothetical protein